MRFILETTQTTKLPLTARDNNSKVQTEHCNTWGWGLNSDPRIENGENEDWEVTTSRQVDRMRSEARRGVMTEMADTEVSLCPINHGTRLTLLSLASVAPSWPTGPGCQGCCSHLDITPLISRSENLKMKTTILTPIHVAIDWKMTSLIHLFDITIIFISFYLKYSRLSTAAWAVSGVYFSLWWC